MARPKGKGKAGGAKATGNGKKAAASSATNGGKASKAKRGAAGKVTSVAKDVYSDEEDDEQEERMNAKMDIDGVYEYEQPETFENDSEIDEDEAFNSEDEQSYGNFFQSKKAKQQTKGGKKKSPTGADADDDSDVGTAEFDDDAEDEEEEAGGDLLSDLLGTAPAKRLSTKHDEDEDDDSALENSDDDEPKNLSSLADGLVPERKKKKLQEISTEGVGLSASIAGGDGSGGGELTLSSLLGGGGDADALTTTGDDTGGLNLSKVKKQMRDLETDGSGALQAAVAPVHEERATRKIAYVEKKKDVDLFQTVVRRNRQKETMDFREQTPKMENLTAASLTSKFSAQTSLEKDVEALLKAGDLSDRTIAKDEADELAQKKVSKEEVVARQQELAKMRALMFYEEQKQKRIKKIKSKLYHKIRNSQDKKQTEKQQKQLRELDPELADELEREMAEKRAEERMTLKHTNTSKWVKHQLKRGTQADNETRGAIAEQLRRGEELRRKVHTAASDDEDDEDSGDEEAEDGVDAVTRLQKRLEKQAGALVMEIDEDEANASQTKGLHGMKFMQRAVQKQREKARSETEKLLRELKGEDGLLSDGDELSSGDEGKKAKDNEDAAPAVNNKTRKANKRKNAVATAEDKQAVDKALPKGALQTGNVSMDKGLSARASGAIAVDLGDGTGSKALGLEANGGANGKTIEIGGKKASAKDAKAAAAPVETERNETEENPWLTGAATSTKSKKRNKKAATKTEQSGVDVANAIESLSKAVSKDAAAAADSSLALLTGKNTKKRKLDQTTTTAGAQPVSEPAAPGNKKKVKQTAAAAGAKTDGKLTQEELVRRAFAFADEDEDEIAREKDQIASQDTTAKKGAEIAKLVGMTGWGSWAGDGVKVSYRQQVREQQAKKLAEDTKKQVLASRKDSKMERVLINEKKDKRAAKFAVQDVPYPFTSREEYEMAMRNPLGSDWNTPASTNALTVPKIMKRAGVMINPLALSKADKKEAKKELGKQRKAKF
ncbi:U3 small nucleolar rna-associated protein [Globisporangium polare]